jgi:proprotein convertase subtilisin/kexin type 5
VLLNDGMLCKDCLSVIPSCVRCSLAQENFKLVKCESCEVGFLLLESEIYDPEKNNQVCLRNCPNNFYRHPTKPICVAECPSGYVKSIDVCISDCPDGLFLDSYSKCVEICPYYSNPSLKICVNDCDNYYLNKINNQCLEQCPEEAPFTLFQQDSKICLTSCQSQNLLALLPEKKCVSECPSLYIRYNTSCIKQCPKYISPLNNSEICVEQCPDGYFASNKACRPCNPSCITCVSAIECTSCPEGNVILKDTLLCGRNEITTVARDEENNKALIPVIIGVVVYVLLILVVFLVFKYCRRSRAYKPHRLDHIELQVKGL